MPNPRIDIKGIISGHKLDLSDHRKSLVHSKENHQFITWRITTSKVKSFKIESKTKDHPFTTPIPTEYGRNLQLEIKNTEEQDWNYTIHWEDRNGNYHPDDPLIAIRPRTFKASHRNTEQGSSKKWLLVVIGLIGFAWWVSQDRKKSK
jgi:hypothetical protein